MGWSERTSTGYLTVEENKDGYYRALRVSRKLIRSEEENPDDWLRFLLTSLIEQKQNLKSGSRNDATTQRISQNPNNKKGFRCVVA